MTLVTRLFPTIGCCCLTVLLTAGGTKAQETSKPPKLVLVLAIDQLRSDYLTRFADLFRPPVSESAGQKVYGGFRFLQQRGASFADARHEHYPLLTALGHAVLLTGAQPYKSGIVGNYWYDAEERRGKRYCVEDLSPLGRSIGTRGPFEKEPGISPASLQTSTVGDELRMATGGRAKVWGMALKDRAAVLMAGHLASGVIWFNEDSGDWVSSRYYCPDQSLPSWLVQFNTGSSSGGPRLIDSFTNLAWRFSFPSAADRIWAGPRDFSHSQISTNYKDFTFTPSANEFVLQTARVLIDRERLGADEVPDLLAINFSSNDYVGHKYGSASAEVIDITVHFDRQLGDFLTWLDGKIGLDRLLIVLTSDHGAAPTPQYMREDGHFEAGVAYERAVEEEFNRQVTNWFGLKSGETNAVRVIEYNLYVRKEALRTSATAAVIHEQLAEYAVRTKSLGFYAAYTRERILSGQLPRTDICARVMNGFHPENSGDIVLVPRPFWVHLDPKYPYITSHGSPYTYDVSVPLVIAGPGVRTLQWLKPVATLDIAPTLSYLLGILPPSGSEGRILTMAVEPR